MGVTFKKEGNLLVFTLDAVNTREEAEHAFREAFALEQEAGQRPNVLIDAGSSQRNRPVNEVASLAEFFGGWRDKVGDRCALFLKPERVDQERLERYLAAFSGRFQIRFFMFHDRHDAVAWLKEPE